MVITQYLIVLFGFVPQPQGPAWCETLVSAERSPSAYLPRYDDIKEDIIRFEEKIDGSQQSVLDFAKLGFQIRKIMSDYRRAYPQGPIAAEDRVAELYSALQPALTFFAPYQRNMPSSASCRNLILSMEQRELGQTRKVSFVGYDTEITIRLVEKLCGIYKSNPTSPF